MYLAVDMKVILDRRSIQAYCVPIVNKSLEPILQISFDRNLQTNQLEPILQISFDRDLQTKQL
jgi:hypothetical protein